MKIYFESHTYNLSLDDITVAQAKVIKVHRGMTLKGLTEGLRELDADALASAYWLMMVQSGVTGVDIDRIDFPAVRFAQAVGKAGRYEDIRGWLLEHGHDFEESEEIPPELQAIYDEAHRDEEAPKDSL